jgi:HAD superfamily hydrolase (TIGR01490 family)
MALAIFDLDNTLLGGDSDYLWGEYLVETERVNSVDYQRMNQHFYDQYLAGTMDIFEFSAFQFKPLADNSMATLMQWRDDYLAKKIDSIILPAALALIEKHRQQNDTLLIITATNSFITTPIASKLAIPNLIATEPEVLDGQFTGKVSGTPSYQQGKVTRLKTWLTDNKQSLAGSYFYSDSHNDVPLLDLVDQPIAVDPDPKLRAIAQQRHWPILSLR